MLNKITAGHLYNLAYSDMLYLIATQEEESLVSKLDDESV